MVRSTQGFSPLNWALRQLSWVFLISWVGLVSSPYARSEPLRDPSKLIRPVPEMVARVTTAQVILADYEAIREDFPELRDANEEQINKELIKRAIISRGHLQNSEVNSEVQVETLNGEVQFTEAIRPTGYGRALIKAFFAGFLDIKGAGGIRPRQGDHSNGLLHLGEAIREFLMENLVRRVLAHAGYTPGTTRSYAVIDYGFDVINADGTRSRAGAYVRRAEEREVATASLLGPSGYGIESILRKYGILSDYEAIKNYEYQTIDRHNVQATKSGAVIDYGSMLSFSGQLKQSPIQPDESLRVSFSQWGYSMSSDPHPVRDNIRIMADHWIRDWEAGQSSISDLQQKVKTLLHDLDTKYSVRSCQNIFRN